MFDSNKHSFDLDKRPAVSTYMRILLYQNPFEPTLHQDALTKSRCKRLHLLFAYSYLSGWTICSLSIVRRDLISSSSTITRLIQCSAICEWILSNGRIGFRTLLVG